MLFPARTNVVKEFRNSLMTYVVYSHSFRYFQQRSVQEMNTWPGNEAHAFKINEVRSIHREQDPSPSRIAFRVARRCQL